MRVQASGLEGGEAPGDAEELLAHLAQMVEPLPQAEVRQIIRADFVTQEGGEFLVLFDKGVLPVGTKDVMAMLDLFKRRVQVAMQPVGDAPAEDFRDLVHG